MDRNYQAEAAALPHFQFDLLQHRHMMRSFRPYFGETISALELGCFEGAFTSLLQREFEDVCVIEASLPCILKARVNLPLVEFIHGTFETAKADRRFDAIFCIHVLEHTDDPVLVLRRFKEWLLPGGRAFIAVPNGMALSRQIAAKIGVLDSSDPLCVTAAEAAHGHRRTYDRNMLNLHIAEADLRIIADGGITIKPLANFQSDAALKHGIISDDYLEACYALSDEHPEICASLYAVVECK